MTASSRHFSGKMLCVGPGLAADFIFCPVVRSFSLQYLCLEVCFTLRA